MFGHFSGGFGVASGTHGAKQTAPDPTDEQERMIALGALTQCHRLPKPPPKLRRDRILSVGYLSLSPTNGPQKVRSQCAYVVRVASPQSTGHVSRHDQFAPSAHCCTRSGIRLPVPGAWQGPRGTCALWRHWHGCVHWAAGQDALTDSQVFCWP